MKAILLVLSFVMVFGASAAQASTDYYCGDSAKQILARLISEKAQFVAAVDTAATR